MDHIYFYVDRYDFFMPTYTRYPEKAEVTVLRITSDACLSSSKFWVAEHKIPPDPDRNRQVFVLKSSVHTKN